MRVWSHQVRARVRGVRERVPYVFMAREKMRVRCGNKISTLTGRISLKRNIIKDKIIYTFKRHFFQSAVVLKCISQMDEGGQVVILNLTTII
jgi:hypothetical protein